jgi:superfamily II DNA or RNA helicase
MELNLDEVKFLSALKKLGGFAGQYTHRNKLRWGSIRYQNIKKDLFDKGFIKKGKGRGGSIQLLDHPIPISGFSPIIGPENEGTEENESDVDIVIQTFNEDSWEKCAIEWLKTHFSQQQLEKFVGLNIIETLKLEIKYRFEKQRKPNKTELATALILTYRQDLFFSGRLGREIREIVAKKLKIELPARMTAGKQSAFKFVTDVGAPEVLAGEVCQDNRESFEIIEGRIELKPLEDYQFEVKKSVLEQILDENELIRKSLVSLPTGAGKTRTACEIIHEWVTSVFSREGNHGQCNLILWTAQTDELCEQAFQSFKELWTAKPHSSKIKIVRFWGGFWRDSVEPISAAIELEEHPVILISTVQTMDSIFRSLNDILERDQLADAIQEHVDLVVIDEAHHAAARSYRNMLEKLIANKQLLSMINDNEKFSPLTILGLTATPYRSSGRGQANIDELMKIFKKIHFPTAVLEREGREKSSLELKKLLQERHVLSKEEIQYFETDIVVNTSTAKNTKEIDEMIKQKIIKSNERRVKVVDAILGEIKENPGASILYFGIDVADSMAISSLLNIKGIKSVSISEETLSSSRQSFINDFKNQKIQVICNCKVLTTGFDAPKITHVFIGYPLGSLVLFHQMIGRGLRGSRFGGTEMCKVIVVKDKIQGSEVDYILAHEEYMKEWF